MTASLPSRRLRSLGLRYQRDAGGARLEILDQAALPDREEWRDGAEPEAMIGHIRALRVRGAPMIGVCAALCLAVQADRGAAPARLREDARALRAARPTAVNLMEAVDRLLPLCAHPEALVQAAEALFEEEVARSEGMATRGAALVQPGEGILTHCNTGGLATSGAGTALAVIRRAHEQGKGVHVWVDETRPLLQGGRLTAWELGRLGIPYHLLPDGAAGLLFARGRVQRVLVGADRIAGNGDFANKIGTFPLAVLARHHGVPFHVVAPRTTVDPSCPDGTAIPIEERDADEVRGLVGRLRWAPADAPVFNPAFDVTPAALVTSWILDDAVLDAEDVAAGALA
ncbi:S-methyl-5-thioribose-1-phosphate isomerase [Myxococcota bacterium]|nr:S-methyl-5-thioribose-1-phosphate isomerase [Myxococcota bacterium]